MPVRKDRSTTGIVSGDNRLFSWDAAYPAAFVACGAW